VNGLTYADFSTDHAITKVATKTGFAVSLDLKLRPLTLGLLQQVQADKMVVPFIVDENSGRPYAARGCVRKWRAVARQPRIPDTAWKMDVLVGAITDFTSHDCRRTFATQPYAKHQNTAELMLICRWKSPNMALRSAHENVENLLDGVYALGGNDGENTGMKQRFWKHLHEKWKGKPLGKFPW
jgi:integrase